MDHATEIGRKLKLYAATLAAGNAQYADDYAIEQWLGFWDENDSTYGNVRNLEHWLTLAKQQPAGHRVG